jgi:hypothetical protein
MSAATEPKGNPMKKMLILAAAPLILLAACATPDKASNSGPATVAGSGTYYCWKDRLTTEGERLGCNWAPTVADACRFNEFNYVDKKATAGEPEKAGRCQNGEWLMKVTTK